MKKYVVVIHYQDKICVVDAESEQEAMEKAERNAYSGIELNGMELIESVKN